MKAAMEVLVGDGFAYERDVGGEIQAGMPVAYLVVNGATQLLALRPPTGVRFDYPAQPDCD